MLKVQIDKNSNSPFHFIVVAENLLSENLFDNGKIVGDIEIDGEIVNDGKEYFISGKITCTKIFNCDRCLEESTETQVHSFDEEIDRREIVDDLIDITELLKDTLVINQPIKNLCSENCKGLCPICGTNLNSGDCNCNRSNVDPRLAPLRNLRL